LVRSFKKIPELIERLDEYFPALGAAPPAPPLPDIPTIEQRVWWSYALVGVVGAIVGALLLFVLR
jgi:ubiquinone biosynthesis protein